MRIIPLPGRMIIGSAPTVKEADRQAPREADRDI
jgi:hypothetical protein